jgi:hypothetical protein
VTGKGRSRSESQGSPGPSDAPAPGDSAPPDVPEIRGPLQGLQDLSEIVAEHPPHMGAFVRGLTVGALVGAAIAGSAIWRRWRRGKGGG